MSLKIGAYIWLGCAAGWTVIAMLTQSIDAAGIAVGCLFMAWFFGEVHDSFK